MRGAILQESGINVNPNDPNFASNLSQLIQDVTRRVLESTFTNWSPPASVAQVAPSSGLGDQRGGVGPTPSRPNQMKIPVSKWKIVKFDGREENLARFLARVEQFAAAEEATKDDLFRNRIHLFSGHAADFVILATHVRDWDELVQEVTRFARGSTSDCDLLRRIEQSRQGKEPCAVYLTKMEMLFKNLKNRITEEEKCDIIIRNLRPSIRSALAGNLNVRKMSELRDAAQRVEKLTAYQREVQTVEQEVDQVDNVGDKRGDPRRRNGRNRPKRQSSPNPRPPQNHRRSPTRRSTSDLSKYADKDFCLNCGCKTHLMAECTENKRVVCYGCGELGYFVNDCPKCSGNETAGR